MRVWLVSRLLRLARWVLPAEHQASRRYILEAEFWLGSEDDDFD